jgi:hypothetical protein
LSDLSVRNPETRKMSLEIEPFAHPGTASMPDRVDSPYHESGTFSRQRRLAAVSYGQKVWSMSQVKASVYHEPFGQSPPG